ncbi:MAG: FAD-dependent oxidoreductase [Planctomycetaceae bacterium]|nr:FAD-dependent oxidoreductase [Planctomycetaceae bacterium]
MEPATQYPPHSGPLETDVLIVGGGITGLTAAMHLVAAGRKVAVLEAGRIGAGTTAGTSGHLEALPDQGAGKLIRDFGCEAARAVTRARMEAIDQIETWCHDLATDADFRRVPACSCTESNSEKDSVRQECEHVRELGLDAAMLDLTASGLPLPAVAGFRVERQGRFHSVRYLRALAQRLQSDGCRIHEHTRAMPPRDGDPCTVETAHGQVTAGRVLLCTHSAYLGISEIDIRVAPYQSYVMTVRVREEFPDVLYWDDAEPYHYIRRATAADPHLLIVGGADHKTGQGGNEAEACDRLERYVRERFDVTEILQRWSAEYFEPADGLPLIGRVPFRERTFLATGFSGTGLTFGTVAGRVLADLVLERETPLADIFSMSRLKLLAAGKGLLTENLNAAHRFVADRFGGREIDSLDEIAAGEGAVVQYRGSQWAVYRDPQQAVHVLSPVCTHAGCHVQWNEAEHTWDCPCHGGRFSPQGQRLYGPPADDLEQQAPGEL